MTWNGIVGAGNSITAYINGTPCQSVGLTAGSGTVNSDTSYNFEIGDSRGASLFGGMIDDVRVYNRALTASEVLQLYNMGK
ncbi:hypothetical protein KGQ31_03615 [Patescibacteria group bacterium]|nr:hypothetical protein [Patescibacteria group bacterium]